MGVEITLTLSEEMVEHVRYVSQATHQSIEDVLSDTLEIVWPTLHELPVHTLYPPVLGLSDEAVLELANKKMDVVQNERLGYLQTKGKPQGLDEAERFELSALMQIYRLGQLRKSEALAEAIRRNLQKPFAP